MTNAELSRIFNEVADMLEIEGTDFFRVNAYRRVARTIDDLPSEIADHPRDRLEELPNVGKSQAAKIHELLETGRLEQREKLAREVPEGLLRILEIPGTGPKRVRQLWKELDITSIESLKSAIEDGSVAELKGLGKKTADKMLEGIAFLERSSGRTRLSQAWPLAETLCAAIRKLPGVKRVEAAGSLRRGRETVHDVDLICVADNPPKIVEAFTKLSGASKVIAAGDTKGSALFAIGEDREIQVDLRVVEKDAFGAALLYFTGSKEHNVRLRGMAQKRGWTLNEYALTEEETGRVVASKTEEDIYKAIGVPWIPPELREDRGELEWTETPTDLITVEDIRGELHAHTTASDGRHSIEQMLEAAKKRGYSYLCITDHSTSSVIANGLTPERMAEHAAAVRAAGKRAKFDLWMGSEVDILPDGSIDYDDETLATLDWVIASAHVWPQASLEHNTERIIRAMRNPYVNAIGHPTGRLLGRREEAALDMDAICRVAAETGTALEINATGHRLDLSDRHTRLARERGCKIVINCDAHSIDGFEQMRYGVVTGRRAGLRKDEVVNTWPAKRVREFVAAKRER
ncbi:MAG: DNA polymerase/3'-5' exonuclease PolX [Phycisphaerales bacterium]|nr:DNA polymerase/3'-5' exonuclease PolX [Phycisphaerales bacterium]